MTSDMGGSPGRDSHPVFTNAQLSKYRDYVAHLEMTESAKDELLNVVWRIMGNFVERAFGDDPVQHVNEIRKTREVGSAPMLGLGKSQTNVRLSSAFASPAAGRGRKERS